MSSEAQPQEQDQHLRAQVELLRSEGQSGASSADGDYPSPPPGQANEGDQDAAPAAARDAQRALNHRTDHDYIHPELRAAHGQQPPASMMPMPPSAPVSGPSHSPAAMQPSQPELAPAATMATEPSQEQRQGAASQTSPTGNGRKQPTRELSQTKRAAQNRAAQRAFRHRKETYIRQLEDQNKNYINMEKAFKGLQSENYALREYVLTLQARMLDATGDFPPPPPNVNISPGNNQPQQTSPLEAVARDVARAVADLAGEGVHQQQQQQQQHQHQHEHQQGEQEHADVVMKQEPSPHTDEGQPQQTGSQA